MTKDRAPKLLFISFLSVLCALLSTFYLAIPGILFLTDDIILAHYSGLGERIFAYISLCLGIYLLFILLFGILGYHFTKKHTKATLSVFTFISVYVIELVFVVIASHGMGFSLIP